MDRNEAALVRVCVWSGVLFLIVFGIGWGILGDNIPPYSPDLTAEEIAAKFQEHEDRFRIGYALGAFGCAFMVPWTIGIFRIMLRMGDSLILPWCQLAGGLLTSMVPMFACIVWLTAAFRPEQDPENVRMLVDMGWLCIDLGFGVTLVQYVAFGVMAMRDERSEPLFPSWLGWLGILIAFEFMVELIMPYFRDGPFAWNGVFGYWIPFFAPFAWMALVMFYMLRAATRLEQEGPGVVPAGAARAPVT